MNAHAGHSVLVRHCNNGLERGVDSPVVSVASASAHRCAPRTSSPHITKRSQYIRRAYFIAARLPARPERPRATMRQLRPHPAWLALPVSTIVSVAWVTGFVSAAVHGLVRGGQCCADPVTCAWWLWCGPCHITLRLTVIALQQPEEIHQRDHMRQLLAGPATACLCKKYSKVGDLNADYDAMYYCVRQGEQRPQGGVCGRSFAGGGCAPAREGLTSGARTCQHVQTCALMHHTASIPATTFLKSVQACQVSSWRICIALGLSVAQPLG